MVRRTRPAALLVVFASTAVLPGAGEGRQPPVVRALDLYDRGEYDGAIGALDLYTLSVGELRREAERWIEAGARPAVPRRRLVAASLAVDALWVATRHDENRFHHNRDPANGIFDREQILISRLSAGFVVVDWAADLVPDSGPATTAEHWWRLAALGVLQDGHAWTTLLDARHLPRAQARLPAEPRLRLVDAVARAASELGTLRESNVQRADVLRDERLGSSVTRRFPAAIRRFDALLADRELAGEAQLRIGYLELRRRSYDEALAHFGRARMQLTDPFLMGVSNYMQGWVLEALERFPEAVDAYQRAHAIAPGMRELSTRLAALLFERGDRDAAHDILQSLHAAPPQFELLTMFERGDARFVPDYLAELRRALR